MALKSIKIGGASGYWGDAALATPQLLSSNQIDYLVYDYLAEVTMSILARARSKSADAGYATDFVTIAMRENLRTIAHHGVKVISNAGGLNPVACANALKAEIDELGLSLKVAVVLGDDLTHKAAEFENASITEMFSGEQFPGAENVESVNAYLGAFPIAAALDAGADIVITGRCVDSAVTLGACIHSFGWKRTDLDRLAAGSLAGHIIECGPQATGGNFTDWRLVSDTMVDIGYPIVNINPTGTFECFKPKGTGGIVSTGTIGEQMLYEIGDPRTYLLPDVTCDFSGVKLQQLENDRVRVTGVKGAPPTDTYKMCATYNDGWRAAVTVFFYGEEAAEKANAFANMALERSRRRFRASNLGDFEETLVELIGAETHYGAHAKTNSSREIAMRIGVRHQSKQALSAFLKEVNGAGLGGPPGLTGFGGARAKPSPVVRLYSFLLDKEQVPIEVTVAEEKISFDEPSQHAEFTPPKTSKPILPICPAADEPMIEVELIKLAFARSGDKGDKSNIGVLPREQRFVPWIWSALSEQEIKSRFEHLVDGQVTKFFLPGTGAINILMDKALGGGGVASLRTDPQGKGFAQVLLQTPIPIPRSIAETL